MATVNRREFIWTTGLGMLAAALPGVQRAQSAAESNTPPNIFFAFADDWGWPHAGAYGDPTVRTPTFDKLGREGVLFEHAYLSSPSCTPSRGSVLTGQHFWRLREGANLWSTLDASFDVYPDLLEDAGYHVGHTRKGWGPGQLEPGGRERNPAGPGYPDFEQFLEERSGGQPFCFWFGAQEPHRPYDADLREEKGIDPDEVETPPIFPDAEPVREDIADYYAEVEKFDREVGEKLAVLEEMGELDNTIVVMSGDHGWPFPRGKGNLYDLGTRVPLAIWWPDGATGGRTVTDMTNLTDLAPTFLEAAGLDVPEAVTGRSLLPLLQTEAEGRVDESRDAVFTGRERHVPAQGGDNGGGYPSRAIRTDEYLYIINFEPDRWPAGTPNWEDAYHEDAWLADCDNGLTKYYLWANRERPDVQPLYELSFGKRPAEELYHLALDPYQVNNVAGESAYAAIREQLRERLMDELRRTEDPRALNEGGKFDEYPYYGGVPTWPGEDTLGEYGD
ncbi:MAG: sulfatase [Candidatus Hydrogenedentota bacterium]